MKRTLAFLLVATLAVSAHAFTVGAYLDLSNLDFQRDRESTATTLPGSNYLWGISAFGYDELGQGLALDLSFRNDTILRNIAFTRLAYLDDFFSITFGPFFGILNAPGSFVQSGISTSVELFLPGIAFVRLRSDNSLSGRLVVTGDYLQEQSELAVGFYLPNVIPTLYIASRRYTEKGASGEIVDSRTEYGVQTDVFQKNVPYRVVLDFAYQSTSRQFIEASTVTHTYGSLVLGGRLSLSLFKAFTVIADLESSIYTFGLDDLVGEVSADSFLFRLSAGIEIDLGALGDR